MLEIFRKWDPCCWIVVILLPLAFGYSLHIEKWKLALKKEVREIERINGKERKAIEELQNEVADLRKQLQEKCNHGEK